MVHHPTIMTCHITGQEGTTTTLDTVFDTEKTVTCCWDAELDVTIASALKLRFAGVSELVSDLGNDKLHMGHCSLCGTGTMHGSLDRFTASVMDLVFVQDLADYSFLTAKAGTEQPDADLWAYMLRAAFKTMTESASSLSEISVRTYDLLKRFYDRHRVVYVDLDTRGRVNACWRCAKIIPQIDLDRRRHDGLLRMGFNTTEAESLMYLRALAGSSNSASI